MSDLAHLSEEQLRSRIRNYERLAQMSSGFLRPGYGAKAEECRRLLNDSIERRR